MHAPLPTRLVAILVSGILLAACGEETETGPETLLPERPEDKLIEETGRPERVVEDPTPETGTGGTIPGYDPTEED